MIRHQLEKYTKDGAWFAESWIELNLFGKKLFLFAKTLKI